jgi:DDB1- and CUL4-associated factor 8
VNTLCFNTDGSILLSGSDDRKIILWDWEAGLSKYSFHTGHSDNILNAQFMPWSNDTSIITCSADGQVSGFFFCQLHFFRVPICWVRLPMVDAAG